MEYHLMLTSNTVNQKGKRKWSVNHAGVLSSLSNAGQQKVQMHEKKKAIRNGQTKGWENILGLEQV